MLRGMSDPSPKRPPAPPSPPPPKTPLLQRVLRQMQEETEAFNRTRHPDGRLRTPEDP